MKKHVFLLALGLFYGTMNAQNSGRFPEEKMTKKPLPGFYIGLGSGLNNYSGLIGLELELPVNNQVSITATAGLGGWGYKFGGSFQYYVSKAQYGSVFGIGYSNAFGIKNLQTDLRIEGYADPQTIDLTLEDAGTVNFTYNYAFHLGKKSKFVLGAGYALAVVDNPYAVLTPNVRLTEESLLVMDILQPGGLLFSMKMIFGVE